MATTPLTPFGTDEEISRAFAAHQAAVPAAAPEAPAGPRQMIGADGKLYTVPEASVKTAIKNGWRHASDEDLAREQKIKAGVAEAEEHRVTGGLKRFGNEALMGVPELIAEHEQSPEDIATAKAVEERFSARHPWETGLETAAGFVAPMLIPGVGEAGEAVARGVLGAGEAAAGAAAHDLAGAGVRAAEAGFAKQASASLGRKIAASAAKVATEGAIYSTPQAAVSLAYGDPEQAAETMLWGIGLSGALGAGGKLLGEGAKAAIGKAGELAQIGAERLGKVQPNGLTLGDDIGRNVMGITDKRAQKLGHARIARMMERVDQEGILSASPKDHASMIEAMRADAGQKFGAHQDKLEELLKNKDLRQHGPVPLDSAKKFGQEMSEKFPELLSSTHEADFNFSRKIYDDIAAGGEKPSFEKLQQIRQTIKSSKKQFLEDSPQHKLIQLADRIIKTDLEASAQKLYTEGKLPEQFADYLSQKERYEAAKEFGRGQNAFKGTGRIQGGTIGGPLGLRSLAQIGVGFGIGPIAGAVAIGNVAREHATKAFMANEGGLLGKSVSWMRKAAADPATAPIIGGLMAKEGSNALTAHIDRLPAVLSGSHVVGRASADAVSRLTGPTTGLSKEQQYDRLTAQVRQASLDADLTAQRTGALASTFSGTSVGLAHMVAQKKLAAVAYLAAQIPKNPKPATPFQRGDPWKPTEAQRKEFLAKASVVNNPMIVWEHFQAGALSKNDRDTLSAVYPKVYQSMVKKILATAYDPRAPALSHQKRIQLSMFTGQPLDRSLANLSAIQQAISAPTQQGQQDQGQGGAKPSGHPKMKAPRLATDTTRRTFGGRVA